MNERKTISCDYMMLRLYVLGIIVGRWNDVGSRGFGKIYIIKFNTLEKGVKLFMESFLIFYETRDFGRNIEWNKEYFKGKWKNVKQVA